MGLIFFLIPLMTCVFGVIFASIPPVTRIFVVLRFLRKMQFMISSVLDEIRRPKERINMGIQ